LSWWSDNPGKTDGFYIGIYCAIGVTNAVFVLARALLFAFASINSAKKIHDKLLDNVLHVPMSFFDTTPAGRILNRFSKDLYTLDQTLPRTVSMFIIILFASVSILLVIGAVTPFFLTAIIPLAWLYLYVQNFYIRTSREVQRLDGVSRSPIYSHFDETLAGVSSIRAFGRVEDFILENEQRLDTNQRAYWVYQTANRWLGLRLELLGAVVVSLASLFCVVERENIDAGAAGLSLTYALQTTSLLTWLVRMYTETESQMVCIFSSFFHFHL
jgi:ABC-type multidrug transport system fused ATPase/permease subunit